MMRARYEPVLNAFDNVMHDTDQDVYAVQSPRAVHTRAPRTVRHVPAPTIGTRTLGRPGSKSTELTKVNPEWAITISARPGRANVLDAFSIVLEVVDESSSWNQGLRSRDLFVNFGGMDKKSFIASGSNLECLLPIVSKSADTPLECVIIRGQRLFNITLRGMRWDHGVCLGAVINTYPEPVPRSSICPLLSEPHPLSQDGQNRLPTNVLDTMQDVAAALERRLRFGSSLPLHNLNQCDAFQAA